MASFNFDDCLHFAVDKLNLKFKLHDQQVETLKELFNSRDTVAILPTGYGKSLIYQLLPYLMQRKYRKKDPMIVLVVSPLNCIMEDQVQRMQGMHGIKACYLSFDARDINTFENYEEVDSCNDGLVNSDEVRISCQDVNKLKDGEYQIIYSHPETLKHKKVVDLLMSSTFCERVCAVVVDEVHMIAEWGDHFRPAFMTIGELTCLFPDACHLALTATCTSSRLSRLTDSLQYFDYSVIKMNPDRSNIYINVKSRLPNNCKYQKLEDMIKPIAVELCDSLLNFPVTIMYMENLESLGFCYQYLDHFMKDRQYVGEHIPENRLFAQYHKDYTKSMKSLIVQKLTKDNPTIRLVLATVALGMGLNAPSIVRIIHCRPPLSLENYMQEIGRAGRGGQTAEAVLYFNKNDIARSRKNMTDSMIEFCKNDETCYRLKLVKYFGFNEVIFSGDKRNCCSNCRKSVD